MHAQRIAGLANQTVLRQHLTQSMTSKKKDKCTDTPQWVSRLFVRFTTIYQRRWTDNQVSPGYTRELMREWGSEKMLAAITDQELDSAIDYCKTNLEWPPNIAEFVKIVLMMRKEITRQQEFEDVKSGRYLTKKDDRAIKLRVEITNRLKLENPDKSIIALLPLINAEVEKELSNAG